ncbi:MAG: hypothetical protein Q9201_005933 [Fulgogasparrea decipioides]
MASSGIRITEVACKGVGGALFGLAILAAFARTSIRFRSIPRPALDDALLLFACICLTAATGLFYKLVPKAYLYEELNFNATVALPFPISDLAKETTLTIRILHAYTFISWLVIFAVKFCFLAFFRVLIDRVKRMIIYWRFVVVITVILGGISFCETFIACPHIDASSVICLQGPGFRRTLAIGILAKCLDIVTDILLITIPVALLWNVRIKTRQKLGIGAFLCLSVVMVIVAIVKASGIRTSVDSFDLVWEIFWQQIEACVAVLMVSFTAFRSIFISGKSKANKRNDRPSVLSRFLIWLSSRKYSRGDVERLSPSNPTDRSPPHVTLGTRFQSIQRMGLSESKLQPKVNGDFSADSIDPENWSAKEPHDFETVGAGERDHNPASVTCVTRPEGNEHWDGRKILSHNSTQGGDSMSRGHWWQMGILTNFSLSNSKGNDSDV